MPLFMHVFATNFIIVVLLVKKTIVYFFKHFNR